MMQLKVNWPPVILYLVMWSAMCIVIGGIVTKEVFGGVWSPVPTLSIWSWLLVVSVDSLCFATFLWGAWIFYCVTKTIITDEYISQPRLFGTFKMAWSQTRKMELHNNSLAIYGGDSKIIFFFACYTNPDEILEKMEQIVVEHLIPFSYVG